MEPLRPASEEEIRGLIQIYETRIPEAVQFLLILQNILRINTTVHGCDLEEASHRIRKTIYVPNNHSLNRLGTFVAISYEDDLYIMAHSLEEPPLELSDALQNTQLIKWHLKPTFVVGEATLIHETIHQKAKEISLRIDTFDFVNYWLQREKAANLNVVIPSDVQLMPLEKEHGKLINEWWTYRYKMSQWYIESAIKHNGALGLFDKITAELVACVFKNDLDGIAHLYTVPDRYNKGYGTTLAKAMARLIAVDHQQQVQTFITANNEKSIKLFEKLGFVAVNKIYWLILQL
ncbi:uncharacterized protein LOC128302711 [Anopheles moucheti]|uniref:uncharacterized protein LOC128302711 n=1 Tax=Anopheles moucheti TaxID=186751 RepID=UPI0022F0649F|nr:uncharacterized protein LOC128302711 [Anopheles moucheti]